MWLTVAILSYFLFAIVSLGDRYLLLHSQNPKVYTFYVGILGILALAIIPFIDFFIPDPSSLLLCFLSALFYIIFIFLMYRALGRFEVSRIVPAMGAMVPLMTFIIIYFISKEVTLAGKDIFAFIFLILGSVIITLDFSKRVSFKSLKVSLVIALFGSLAFVFAKYAYMALPFWTGFVWIRICAFLIALFFIFSKTVRKEVAGEKKSFGLQNPTFFILNQIIGALAYVLQNWAIALAGLAFLPMINALQGTQYAFIFILIILISSKLPNLFKENFSKKVALQKISAIIAIGIGFVFLAII